ncbi:MAG TPA: hypothetical protein VEQ86_04495 [Xanthobacteraceae bacterium]|nr:hypothetical protein [Xanthobacteraceae bacterium]
MFPNVRLMVVAILAAITGISCGLGLFATFRVNHEPLARLAEGSPPLQLALNNRSLGSEAGAPLEARLPGKDAARLISVPVILVAPSPAPSREPSPAPSRTPSPAPEQSGADSALAGDSSVQNAAAENQSKTASLAAPAEQFSTAPEAVAPGRQEAAVSDQQPAATAATAPPAAQTATINAAPDQQPAAKPKKADESKAARPAAKATGSAPARRVAKTVRARRTVAKAVAQPTYEYSQPAYAQPTYPQPSYTWADGTAQAPQPIKRVQIKRHGTAKKATPAAQSTPSAATAGLNGTQSRGLTAAAPSR